MQIPKTKIYLLKNYLDSIFEFSKLSSSLESRSILIVLMMKINVSVNYSLF